jgi:hypothetical protein
LFVLVKILHVKNHLVMSCFLVSCIPRYFRVVMNFLVSMKKMSFVNYIHQLMNYVNHLIHRMSFEVLMLLLLNGILLVMLL